MFKEQIECVVEPRETEIAIRLAAREVMLILTQKIAEHVKGIVHVGGAHFSTGNHALNDATRCYNPPTAFPVSFHSI